jgi:ubiquinone/menaquinone biosynthesis C-methylase UbiE
MTKFTSNTSTITNSWDTYWRGSGNAGAFSSGGVSHPVIKTFWLDFFELAKSNYKNPRIIDIASGNGAVVESALKVFEDNLKEITALDVSTAAIKNINERYPKVKGVVTDASSIPLDDGCFDIVTSQFGVEYAGIDAIFEASRLVADRGLLTLLLHTESGSIHQECQQSLDAVEKLQASNFILFATQMFDAAFKTMQGANRLAYEQAANKLAPAINVLEDIMRQYGQHVAGDTLSRLYNDVGEIHQRIQHYQPDDVLGWLNKMDLELNAYTERMSSMNKSSINELDFALITTELINQGFLIESAEKLAVPEQEHPMAWILIAKKSI